MRKLQFSNVPDADLKLVVKQIHEDIQARMRYPRPNGLVRQYAKKVIVGEIKDDDWLLTVESDLLAQAAFRWSKELSQEQLLSSFLVHINEVHTDQHGNLQVVFSEDETIKKDYYSQTPTGIVENFLEEK